MVSSSIYVVLIIGFAFEAAAQYVHPLRLSPFRFLRLPYRINSKFTLPFFPLPPQLFTKNTNPHY
jgi:hypothetical protein